MPIEIVLKFKRMCELGATIDCVKCSLRDSKVVEIKDNFIKKIDTEEFKRYITSNDIDQRFIHIKGFDKNMSLGEIEEMLSKYIDFALIRMRRDKKKAFKGSVLVELKSAEDATSALKLKIPAARKKCVGNEDVNTKEERENEKEAIRGGEEEQMDVRDRDEEGSENSSSLKRKNLYEDEGTKKTKKEEMKYLEILLKNEYFNKKKREKESKKIEKARDIILKGFSGKFYKFENDKKMDIKTIKKIVPNVAFVDLPMNILRFKKAQEFESNEFKGEEGLVKVFRLNESESLEYGKSIKIGVQKGKK
jgi:lupus La protein